MDLVAHRALEQFLFDVGRDRFEDRGLVRLGRVYDRPQHVLHPPFPIASIAARGYWENARELDAELRDRVTAEAERL